MRRGSQCACGLLAMVAIAQLAFAQAPEFRLPESVEAGSAFSVPTSGSGAAVFYIVGPGGAFRRNVRLGETVSFAADDISHAGHYLATLAAGSFVESKPFDIMPSRQPAAISFLARPSRVATNQSDGISGVVYVFDAFHNLVLQPKDVSFALAESAGSPQTRTAATRNGVAWIRMNSATKAGAAQFEARVGEIHEHRVIQQVAADPCRVKINARPSGSRILLETEPVRDCSGNPVPDGTIVSFSETYGSRQATVDVPLKRGIAKTEMPAYRGAVISAAIGVVMGNEIRWGSQ